MSIRAIDNGGDPLEIKISHNERVVRVDVSSHASIFELEPDQAELLASALMRHAATVRSTQEG